MMIKDDCYWIRKFRDYKRDSYYCVSPSYMLVKPTCDRCDRYMTEEDAMKMIENVIKELKEFLNRYEEVNGNE